MCDLSPFINMEFVQAFSPLYAFPIVAVIICAIVVYAFGFKSPVQPPSFDGIEEEKKVSKKRKTKDTSKSKAAQNGKLNGNTVNKVQVSPAVGKKKDQEKSADKLVVEKLLSEKKTAKKARVSSEKKTVEKMKEMFPFSYDDGEEEGWIQLVSKKERKSRKKEEMSSENQTAKPKNSQVDKSGESTPLEQSPAKANDLKKPTFGKKLEKKSKEDVEKVESSKVAPSVDTNEVIPVAENNNVVPIVESNEVPTVESNNADLSVESNKDKVVVVETISALNIIEKVPMKEVLKNEVNEGTGSKSKKKKKKIELINTDDAYIVSSSESPTMQVIPEIPSLSQNAANSASVIVETPEVIIGKLQKNQPKESKSSNVVFDELAGLYPKEREPKKRKKVRRDH